MNERRRLGEAAVVIAEQIFFLCNYHKDDLQTAVNLIVIGEALIKIGKAMKKKLSGKKKRKKKRPRKRRK